MKTNSIMCLIKKCLYHIKSFKSDPRFISFFNIFFFFYVFVKHKKLIKYLACVVILKTNKTFGCSILRFLHSYKMFKLVNLSLQVHKNQSKL